MRRTKLKRRLSKIVHLIGSGEVQTARAVIHNLFDHSTTFPIVVIGSGHSFAVHQLGQPVLYVEVLFRSNGDLAAVLMDRHHWQCGCPLAHLLRPSVPLVGITGYGGICVVVAPVNGYRGHHRHHSRPARGRGVSVLPPLVRRPCGTLTHARVVELSLIRAARSIVGEHLHQPITGLERHQTRRRLVHCDRRLVGGK